MCRTFPDGSFNIKVIMTDQITAQGESYTRTVAGARAPAPRRQVSTARFADVADVSLECG